MNLRIDDHASIGLGGRLVVLRRQHRAGAKSSGDKDASTQHGSILPKELVWQPNSAAPP
jgi:hypothetical protein